MSVVLGAHNITKKEASQQSIYVAKHFRHPCYENYDNDIMLLKVSGQKTHQLMSSRIDTLQVDIDTETICKM